MKTRSCLLATAAHHAVGTIRRGGSPRRKTFLRLSLVAAIPVSVGNGRVLVLALQYI